MSYIAGAGVVLFKCMAKQSKRKPASPLKREMKRVTPAPPGRKRPKLGPDRSPQGDPRETPAKE